VAVTVPPDDVGLSLVESISSAINATDFINETFTPFQINENTLEAPYIFWSHNNRLIGNDF
jgi:hypothetical protein